MSSKKYLSPEEVNEKKLRESENIKQKCVTEYFKLENKKLEDMSLKKSKLVDLAITTSQLDDNGKSEIDWNSVAEEKRVELEHALEINEQLHAMKNSLLEQIKSYKDKMDEMYTFITYFKEVVQDATSATIDETKDKSFYTEDITRSNTVYNN